MTPETAKRLRDVGNTCVEIEQFTVGGNQAEFLVNRQLQLSVHNCWTSLPKP
jgi:hypothetical protein